jgi:hypothetical protein
MSLASFNVCSKLLDLSCMQWSAPTLLPHITEAGSNDTNDDDTTDVVAQANPLRKRHAQVSGMLFDHEHFAL